MKSSVIKKITIRGVFFLLVIAPFAYFEGFYDHFYVYLTGTILTDVIRNEWHIVAISIAVSMFFFTFLSFRRKVKWIEYGVVSAFFVSLFVEMYGIPLTIIFASKYFFKAGLKTPQNMMEFNLFGVGFGADIAMVYGMILIVIGMILIVVGWITLYQNSKKYGISNKGIYSVSRHPQYLGFILMIIGWFFGWPTILTVIFVPILICKYVRLCKVEEVEISREYPEYEIYKKTVPFFI